MCFKHMWLLAFILLPDKQKSPDSEESRLFPSGDPNRFVTVTEGHDAERARDSIMPRSAAT